MRRIAFLTFLLLGCRYRFTPGIYVPLQVGTLYRYTSRYVINDRYEKDRYYTPDSVFILKDTTYKGHDARLAYVRKQQGCVGDTCYRSIDTVILYMDFDTLFMVGDPSNLIPPRFRIFLYGRPHIVEMRLSDRNIAMALFYTLGNPGTRWKVVESGARVKVYPEGYDTASDSTDVYDINMEIEALIEGFEDVSTSYGDFKSCAKVRYDLTVGGGGLPNVTTHALDSWWCDGFGQVKYIPTPQASSYKDSTLTYLELSFAEMR